MNDRQAGRPSFVIVVAVFIGVVAMGIVGVSAWTMWSRPGDATLDTSVSGSDEVTTESATVRRGRSNVVEPEGGSVPLDVDVVDDDQGNVDSASTIDMPLVLVRVVDDAGRSISDALITFCEMTPESEKRQADIQRDHPTAGLEDNFRRLGTTRRSDTEGQARFERSGKYAVFVMAEKAGASGVGGSPGPTAKEIVITLSVPCRVRVQDEGARPVAGVPLGIVDRVFGGEIEPLMVTGVAGTAAIPDWMIGDDERTRFVVVAGPFRKPISARLGLEKDVDSEGPDGTIELTLPLSASVRVHLEKSSPDADITEVLRSTNVTIRRAVPKGAPKSFGGAFDTTYAARGDGRNGFVFSHVGLELDVVVEMTGKTIRSVSKSVTTPMSAGAEKVITLRIDESRPMVTGTLVDENDQPMANVRFMFEVEGRRDDVVDLRRGSRSSRIDTGRTDAAGRFRIALKEGASTDAKQTSLYFQSVATAAQSGQPSNRDGRVELTTPSDSGEADVGTVNMTPVPRLVSGLVVDAKGRPLADVRVNVDLDLEASTMSTAERGRVIDGFIRNVSSPRTKADGKFVIFGSPTDHSLRIHATLAAYDAEPVVCSVGTRGLRIVMRSTRDDAAK